MSLKMAKNTLEVSGFRTIHSKNEILQKKNQKINF
jgi:hypothetical protein